MKTKVIKGLALSLICAAITTTTYAKEVIGAPSNNNGRIKNERLQRKAAGCLPASQQADLDVNNVRARILNGGDMWWDLNSVAKYEIPKVNDANAIRKNALFAGAIWIGGQDIGGNLKMAAMTYRQSGSDYYPGVLDTTSGNIEQARCRFYDKIYKVNREAIELFVEDNSQVDDGIANWPGNGDQFYGEPKILAPFFDANGDGIYDFASGQDYPVLDPSRPADRNKPEDQPGQMLFFVYNDKGNIHSETGGIPIGLELQTIAFGFSTNDEINNMTFYKTKVTNRSFDEVKNCYFGQWVDADLGNYADDYVGCDVARNLGYCYNGDDNDEGILGYGNNPPSVGTTFFEGPRDSMNNEIGITKFVYYNNDWSVIGNPQTAEHYYNYLRGIWKDGSPITLGGTGYQTGAPTSFMFPGDPTDPTQWHEKSAGNTPGDRRYLQSAGPFNLKPGAVNYVTVGVVWAKTTTGGATGSLNLLRLASDKAQKLFNNNFAIVAGPPSPTVQINELDQELIMTFVDSNRFNIKDIENFTITTKGNRGQTLIYKFQGYKVFQLSDGFVTKGELNNTEKARLLLQCDIKDNFAQIINQEQDPDLGVDIPVIKVNGENKGLLHSFSVKDDLFAPADKRLVNFKSYYYLAISYAVCINDPSEPIQYLEGILNADRQLKAIPHKPQPRMGGVKLQASYASGPSLTRLEGKGNGGHILELTQETVNEILRAPYVAKSPVYLGGFGPVNIKVVDPLKVPVADFELTVFDSSVTSTTNSDSLNAGRTTWKLVNLTTNETINSDTSLAVVNEQVIKKWGISVTIFQVVPPGVPESVVDDANGFIEGTFEWADDGKQWLTGLPDNDGSLPWVNWIRSGNKGRNTDFAKKAYEDDFDIARNPMDPFERYEKILGGIIAPYALASRAPYQSPAQVTYGPAYQGSAVGVDNKLGDLASVDIVLTPDRSKWTRAIVLEMSEDPALAVGNAIKHSPRKSASLDRDLKTVIPGETGRSWFPGYAINLETGERLNIMFGEDSYLANENGNDMIWNPTANYQTSQGVSIGGKHYFYIMGRKNFANQYTGPLYDEGQDYMTKFATGLSTEIRKVYSQCMWVMPAVMAPNYSMKDGVPLTEVKIRLRVKKTYGTLDAGNPLVNNKMPRYTFNTADIAPQVSVENGKNAMELIKVVPNPYYAYSAYEGSTLDNRIKITNLPKTCTINIFTLSGTLVKQIKKDEESTSADWDLKNSANVPVASGMYIIHVDAGPLGEKIIKWFGVMRQIDLDSF